MIGTYDEKLAPREENLEKLKTCQARLEIITAAADIKHNDKKTQLADFKKRRDAIVTGFQEAGMSEREIASEDAIKILTVLIDEGYAEIKEAETELARRKAKIEAKIAKADKKAGPYRDRKDQFIRVKEGRPLEIEMPIRESVQDKNQTAEIIISHQRVSSSTQPGSFEAETDSQEIEPEDEDGSEEEKQPTIGECVEGWNEYLKYPSNNPPTSLLINKSEFGKLTNLSGGEETSFEQFKKVVIGYYKFKKQIKTKKDETTFDESLRIFYEKQQE